MSNIEQLQTELKRVEGAKKTREASEAIAKFVRDNEAQDPLVYKQADNPYHSSGARATTICCVIS
jgi:hypothetical protein